MTDTMTRRDVERLAPRSLHAARNWSKADVSLTEWPPGSGREVVVKDMRGRPLWFRLMFARHLLKREWRALEALRDMESVPLPVAMPDADAMVMEFRAGRPLFEFGRDELPESVVWSVQEAVAQMHARGVAHGDLHRKNVLVAPDGSIALIDWATAGAFGPSPRGWRARLFAEWRALDARAVAKIKERHAPQGLSDVERALLKGGSRLSRGVRALRPIKQKIIRSLHAKRGRGMDAAGE